MYFRAALVLTLASVVTFVAAPAATSHIPQQRQPSLAERLPAPDGYEVVRNYESDGTQDFVAARATKGHILMRNMSADDDSTPMTTEAVLRYYADIIHQQGGAVFDDRLARTNGRLDGRIPATKPVFVHVDVSDEGRSVTVVALEENPATIRETPTEEEAIVGSWDAQVNFKEMVATDRPAASEYHQRVAGRVAPLFAPLRGWSWHMDLEELTDGSRATASSLPYRLRAYALAKWQNCATCPVGTDTQARTVFTLDINRVESLGDADQATLSADGFFLDPAAVATTPQVAQFKQGGRLLIVQAGRPPLYVPATREAYARARIRFMQSAAGTPGAGTLTADLEKVTQDLAGMSADDRRAPATDPLGRAVVTMNADYFDRSRGRTAPHFVVIDMPTRYDIGEASLYQQRLIDRFITTFALTDLVK